MLVTTDFILIEKDGSLIIGKEKKVYTVADYTSPAITITGNVKDQLANVQKVMLKTAATATINELRDVVSVSIVSGNTVITTSGAFTTDTVEASDTIVFVEPKDKVTLRDMTQPKVTDIDITVNGTSKLIVFAGAPTILSYQTAAYSDSRL
jgi:putative lipase involved disintegration of autophagic bodies